MSPTEQRLLHVRQWIEAIFDTLNGHCGGDCGTGAEGDTALDEPADPAEDSGEDE